MTETMDLNVGVFNALDSCEMMEIDGGFTWKGFLGAVVAGGVTGALGGATAGGAGALPGGAAGALLGGIGYCIVDLFGE